MSDEIDLQPCTADVERDRWYDRLYDRGNEGLMGWLERAWRHSLAPHTLSLVIFHQEVLLWIEARAVRNTGKMKTAIDRDTRS
jgi:hypothetical protein